MARHIDAPSRLEIHIESEGYEPSSWMVIFKPGAVNTPLQLKSCGFSGWALPIGIRLGLTGMTYPVEDIDRRIHISANR
jgi:hypothetical protein